MSGIASKGSPRRLHNQGQGFGTMETAGKKSNLVKLGVLWLRVVGVLQVLVILGLLSQQHYFEFLRVWKPNTITLLSL